MDIWAQLGEHGRFAVQFAAYLTAMGIIIPVLWKAGRWLWEKYMQIKWLFSEQHDHQIIHDTLAQLSLAIADIAHQVKHNGGTSIPDAIDRFDKKFDERMDQLSSYLRASLHTQSKAIFETDVKGGVTYVNRAFTRLTGVSGSEVMNFGWVNIIQPQYREDVMAKWLRAVKAQRDFDEIVPYIKPDGTKYEAHAVAYVIRGQDGNMLGHLGEIIPLEDQQGE